MIIERHLALLPPKRASGWRRIAAGTWRTAKDPSVYGVLELDARPAMAHAAALSAREGVKVTITHVVGKAVADAVRKHPDINGVLRFGTVHPRKDVTLFFQVAGDAEGEDLGGVTVQKADTKSAVAIAREMTASVSVVKRGEDKAYRKIKALMAKLPGFVPGLLLDLTSFVQFSLNLWSPLLMTPKDPLGSVMITNVGSLGLEFAFAPLVPYSRVPLLIALAAVRERPWVVDGKVEAVPTVRLCVTFDHRLIDGVHAAKLAKAVEAALLAPAGL